jgi:hypothetical protein
MANRVLLNSSGLKVSKPGHDVLTTGVTGLLFSSDFSQASHLTENTVNCDWNEAGFRFISYGKTFPSTPLVQFLEVYPDGIYSMLSTFNGFYWSYENQYQDLEGNTIYNYHRVACYADLDGLRVQSNRAGTNPEFSFYYQVLDYNH